METTNSAPRLQPGIFDTPTSPTLSRVEYASDGAVTFVERTGARNTTTPSENTPDGIADWLEWAQTRVDVGEWIRVDPPAKVEAPAAEQPPLVVTKETPLRYEAFDTPGTWFVRDPAVPMSAGCELAVYSDGKGQYGAVYRWQDSRFTVEAVVGHRGLDRFVLTVEEGIRAACERLNIPCPDLASLPEVYRKP